MRVPSFDELPLDPIPPVAVRERLYRPHREHRRLARPCTRCGIPIGQHAACLGCGALAGDMHPIAFHLVDGFCAGCRR